MNLLTRIIIVVLYLFLLSLSGCRTKYVPVEVRTVDSMVVRDTLVRAQLVPYRDSVSVSPLSGSTAAVSYLFNPYAFSWARWDGTQLHHSLAIWPGKPFVIRIPHFIDRIRRIEVPQVKEVTIPLTRWQRFKMEFGGISFGVCIGLAAVVVWLFRLRRKK